MLTYYLISALLSYFSWNWLLTKPRLVYTSQHTVTKNGKTFQTCYDPIGRKVWTMLLIIVGSLIPILNTILFVVCWIVLLILKENSCAEWDDIFPVAGRSRLSQIFLTC